MSRSSIPSGDPLMCAAAIRQVCAMYFPLAKLRDFTNLEQSPLEISESIDMLRFLENGIDITVAMTHRSTHPVDVKEDIDAVEKILALRNGKGEEIVL